MAIVSIRELIEAGVHFGHRVSRWNPKMAPYIFGKRNLIHIIDLNETVKGIIRGAHFLRNVAARGEEIVFVGTKRQARSTIEGEAKRCEMHYVTERWLGGTLTNFRTILSRVKRLDELEKMEENASLYSFSKKMISALQREKRKIKRNLEGLRKMNKLPGAMFVVDPHREKNAVEEAHKLGIPVVGLLDTDSDPEELDIAIPGNDDAMRSIELIVKRMADAVADGKKTYVVKAAAIRRDTKETAPAPEMRRAERPRRSGPQDRSGRPGGPGRGQSRSGPRRPSVAPNPSAPSAQPPAPKPAPAPEVPATDAQAPKPPEAIA